MTKRETGSTAHRGHTVSIAAVYDRRLRIGRGSVRFRGGYTASPSIETANKTVLALADLGYMLVAEAALFWIARQVRASNLEAVSSRM